MAEIFPWIGTTERSSREVTRGTHEHEIDQRAFLLAQLGFSKKETESRLKAYLSWEFEGVGKPAIVKRVGALVTAAYQRAGVGKK